MIPAMNVDRQYNSISESINKAVLSVLASGKYILGDTVESFERAFADYCGVRYAIGVGNGSDALVIALRALNIGTNDEVITTAMSFSATAEAITTVGAIPVFVDCNSEDYTIDPECIEKAITKNTKAIIPVHLYGQCADMDTINRIAKQHSIKVVEDCAQSAGATYKSQKAGSLGSIGCFSFFPTKNLGCAGDGGIIVTNDEQIYRICRALRAHGSGKDGLYTYCLQNQLEFHDDMMDFGDDHPKYFNFIQGYNSRLDALQSAILLVKLPLLDTWNQRRREIARQYSERITNPFISKPIVRTYNNHIFYVYTVTVDRRDELKDYLKKNDIGTGVYFPIPFHLQKVYQGLGYTHGDMPNAEYIGAHSLVLPMFPELTQKEIDRVIEVVNRWEP